MLNATGVTNKLRARECLLGLVAWHSRCLVQRSPVEVQESDTEHRLLLRCLDKNERRGTEG